MPFSVRNSTAPGPGRIRDFRHGLQGSPNLAYQPSEARPTTLLSRPPITGLTRRCASTLPPASCLAAERAQAGARPIVPRVLRGRQAGPPRPDDAPPGRPPPVPVRIQAVAPGEPPCAHSGHPLAPPHAGRLPTAPPLSASRRSHRDQPTAQGLSAQRSVGIIPERSADFFQSIPCTPLQPPRRDKTRRARISHRSMLSPRSSGGLPGGHPIDYLTHRAATVASSPFILRNVGLG